MEHAVSRIPQASSSISKATRILKIFEWHLLSLSRGTIHSSPAVLLTYDISSSKKCRFEAFSNLHKRRITQPFWRIQPHQIASLTHASNILHRLIMSKHRRKKAVHQAILVSQPDKRLGLGHLVFWGIISMYSGGSSQTNQPHIRQATTAEINLI